MPSDRPPAHASDGPRCNCHGWPLVPLSPNHGVCQLDMIENPAIQTTIDDLAKRLLIAEDRIDELESEQGR